MMKKLFAFVLALGLTLGASACGGAVEETGPFLRDNVTLEDMVEQLSVQYELTMPGIVDQDFLREVFGVEPEDAQAFGGRLSMSIASADSLMAVQAVPGKVEAVQQALEARLAFVRKSFEGVDQEAYAKAQAGRVVTKGDYVFLIIAGRPGQDPAEECAAVESAIDGYFKP